MKRNWSTTAREPLVTTPVFSIHKDRKSRPGDPQERHFYVIDAVDWVNVIPLTTNDEVVLVEQHRHGTNQTSLEIPGGMIDAEDASPEVAAAREMLEETGYAGAELQELGVVHPNPAIQSNRCYSFLARDVRKVGELRLDETEDIEVVCYPIAEIPELMSSGRITHALVLAGFYWYFQRYGFPK